MIKVGKLYYHVATPDDFELILKINEEINCIRLTTINCKGLVYTRLTLEESWHEVTNR